MKIWVKVSELSVGQPIVGIRYSDGIYYCQGIKVVSIDSNKVIIQHPHGDLEIIDDMETLFCIEEN
jgi:hypothetical protein